jgi:hypothetical protein
MCDGRGRLGGQETAVVPSQGSYRTTGAGGPAGLGGWITKDDLSQIPDLTLTWREYDQA